MSKSSSQSNPQTTSNVTNVDRRVGIDGERNRVVGGADSSVNFDAGAGDGFRPTFFFNGTPTMPARREYDLNRDPYGLEPRYDPTEADSGGGYATAPTATPSGGAAGQFGGAADNGASVIGGNVTGFVNSGDVSAPVFTGPIAGPFSFGDGSPVINAPTSAPVIGGDADFRGPVITGNNGPVTINDLSAGVATAAIDNAGRALSTGLGFAEKALGVVAESKKDPNERVAESSVNGLTLAAVAIAGIFAFSK